MTRFLASCEGEGAMGICALQECVCVFDVLTCLKTETHAFEVQQRHLHEYPRNPWV